MRLLTVAPVSSSERVPVAVPRVSPRHTQSYHAGSVLHTSSKNGSPLGTFQFQGRNSSFPTVERKVSSLGKLLFLRWKFNFPRLERFLES